jgi:ribosomal protein S18 acetylase RimI-like enzyme
MTQIRKAIYNDIPTIAYLHIEGWKGAYGGIVDQAYLDSLTLDKRIEDWKGWLAAGESQVFLAEEEGQPAGFIVTGRTKTPPPGSSPIRPSHSAEIYALYLAPAFWRRGIGTKLFVHGLRQLKEGKHSSVCLWVLDANARAKSFYEKLGGQKLGGKMIEIGPSKLKEICFGWKDTKFLLDKYM